MNRFLTCTEQSNNLKCTSVRLMTSNDFASSQLCVRMCCTVSTPWNLRLIITVGGNHHTVCNVGSISMKNTLHGFYFNGPIVFYVFRWTSNHDFIFKADITTQITEPITAFYFSCVGPDVRWISTWEDWTYWRNNGIYIIPMAESWIIWWHIKYTSCACSY